MKDVIKAIQLKKELDGLRPLKVEDESRIMQKFRLDWNYHSNHLEGNSLTFGETKALILFGITAQGKPLKDHFEVTGHNEVVNWILEVVKEDRPLTENFIRELHKLLLKQPYEVDAITPDGQPTKKQVKVGEYKTTPNHVKTPTGEIFRFATPEETPAKMNDLIDDFRRKSADPEVNPILLSAELHYRFIRIHPFDDGNGRTARILMNFILMKFGYPPVIIKTEDKENYFSALRQADAGILDTFIEYIASNLVRSLEIMIQGAKGESIEEDDDWDKEMALLDQKVTAFEKKQESEKLRLQENLKEIYPKSIIPTVERLREKGSSFEKYYQSSYFRYAQHFQDLNSKPVLLSPSQIDPDSSMENLKRFTVINRFRGFKKQAIGTLSFDINIEFSFSPIGFTVTHPSRKVIINKSYGEQLTEKEIDQLVQSELRRHKTFIEKALEEAQKK